MMINRDTQTNLALARMMGRTEVARPGYLASEFDAIHDGAAFDKVLMYAAEHNMAIYINRLDVDVSFWQEPRRRAAHREVLGVGPEHIRRAVCEAIVEAGDDFL